jgi:hypothetical protein
MLLTIYLILAWFTLQVLLSLPRKLPVSANVLLYLAISIIDINKLTIISVKYHLIEINTKLPYFLTVIVHRDIIFTLSFLIFANVYTTSSSNGVKWFVMFFTFGFQLLTLSALRYFGAITLNGWNIYCDMITVSLLMLIAVVCAKWLQSHTGKVGEQHG